MNLRNQFPLDPEDHCFDTWFSGIQLGLQGHTFWCPAISQLCRCSLGLAYPTTKVIIWTLYLWTQCFLGGRNFGSGLVPSFVRRTTLFPAYWPPPAYLSASVPRVKCQQHISLLALIRLRKILVNNLLGVKSVWFISLPFVLMVKYWRNGSSALWPQS